MPDPGEFNPNNRIAPGSDSTERSQPDFSLFSSQIELQKEQTEILKKISDQLLNNQRLVEESLEKANGSIEAIQKIEEEKDKFNTEVFSRISETENKLIQNQRYVSDAVSSFGPQDVASEFKRFASAFNADFRELRNQNNVQRAFNDEILSVSATKDMGSIDSNQLSEVMSKTNISLDSLVTVNKALIDEMSSRGIDTEDAESFDKFKKEKLVDSEFFGKIASILEGEGAPEEQVGIFKNIESRLIEQSDVMKDDRRMQLEKEGENEELPDWFKQVDPDIETMTESLDEIQSNTEPSSLGFLIKTIVATVVALGTVGGILYLLLTKGVEFAKNKFVDYVKSFFTRAVISMGEFAADFGRSIRALGLPEKFKNIGLVVESWFGSIFGSEGQLVSIWNSFKDFIGDFGDFEDLKDIFKGEGFVGKVAKGIIDGLRGLSKESRIIKFITGLFEGEGMFGSAFAKIGSIFKSISKPISTVGSFLGRIGSFFGTIYRVVSPILGTIFRVVSKIALPLTIVIGIIDGIVGAFKGYSKDGIKGAIVGAIASIIEGFTGILHFFGINLDFETIYDYIMSWVNDFWGTLKKHLSGIWDFIVGIFTKVGSWIWAAIKWYWNFFLEYNPISLLYKTLKWVGTKIYNLLTGKEGIGDIIDEVKNFFKSILNGLLGLAQSIYDFITGQSVEEIAKTSGTDAETLAETYEKGESDAGWIAKKTALNVFGMGDSSLSLAADPETAALLAKMKGERTEDAADINKAHPDANKPKPESVIQSPADEGVGSMMSGLMGDLSSAMEGIPESIGESIGNISTNNFNMPQISRPAEPTIVAPQPSRNTEPTIRIMQYSAQPAF
jgi:hypothetical protein